MGNRSSKVVPETPPEEDPHHLLEMCQQQLQRSQDEVASLKRTLAALSPTRDSGSLALEAAVSAASTVQESDSIDAWNAAAWIDSIKVVACDISDALLQPITVDGVEPSEAKQLAYLRSIGRADREAGRAALMNVLVGSSLLDHIADTLYEQATVLAQQRAGTARELQSKFAEDGAFTLSFGGMDTFFGGLEKLLGSPSSNLVEAMKREHCGMLDSELWFTTPNYSVETTSQIEWYFVADPDNGLAFLQQAPYYQGKLSGWPAEADMMDAEGDENESSERREKHGREPRSLGNFEAEWAKVDEALEALEIDMLQEAEFIGARLYTGPCYFKYNAALRGISIASMEERWMNLNRGNKYTTTLHVINSAVVKLGKLQSAAKVYRGVSGGVLPPEFWDASEHNVRGGCEYGFLSTTLNREVAAKYAASGSNAGILFEIQMGMIDRGANLGWLSQYPEEEEILFAPLSGLEVMSTRVQGAIIVVELRLSINLNNRTIEEVIAKMQSSALELVELVWEDFLFNGAPRRALEPLAKQERLMENQVPEWFNLSENYLQAVKDILAIKESVFEMLTQEGIWTGQAPRLSASSHEPLQVVEQAVSGEVRAQRQLGCARLAAREGHHTVAAELLKLAVNSAPAPAENTATIDKALSSTRPLSADGELERWRLHAALLLIRDNSLAHPWPLTFCTLLAEGGSPSVLEACAAMAEATLDVPRAVPGTSVLVFAGERWRAGEIARVREAALTEAGGERGGGAALQFDVEIGRTSKAGVRASRTLLPGVSGLGPVLCEAAGADNVALVQALLERRVCAFCAAPDGTNALHLAAAAGSERVCRLLLAEGIDPYLENARLTSPYQLAKRHGRVGVCSMFQPREPGGDLTDAARQGSALLAASCHAEGDEVATTLVLEALTAMDESDVNASVANGVTPLMVAASAGHLHCVNALLDAKASVDAVSSSGCTALMYATWSPIGDLSGLVAALLSKGGQEIANMATKTEHATALHYAADRGYENCVQALLDIRADSTHRTAAGLTPLMEAAQGGDAGVVQLLIDRDETTIDIPRQDTGVTPLMAVAVSHPQAMQLLLDAKASVSVQDHEGHSALHMAAEYGQEECLRMLLKTTAIDGDGMINLRGKEGTTPLLAACRFANIQCVRLLLAHSADVNETDHSNTTPLMSLCLFSQPGDDELIKILLAEKADVEVTSARNGMTALHLAVAHCHEDATQALLKANADATRTALDANGEGCTPLMLAAMDGYYAIVDLLLTSGVDPNHAGPSGHTPLMKAAEHGHDGVVRQLLRAGALPEARADDGRTVHDFAKAYASKRKSQRSGNAQNVMLALGETRVKRRVRASSVSPESSKLEARSSPAAYSGGLVKARKKALPVIGRISDRKNA